MINFDGITKENIKEHNPHWPQVPDHPYRISIIGSSGSEKTNSLFNLIDCQPDTDKIYLYGNDSNKISLSNWQMQRFRIEAFW